METARDILVLVALGAVSALSVYLIVVLISVRQVLRLLQEEMRAVSARVLPVLDNLAVITERVRAVAESISEHVEGVRGSIDALRMVTEDIVDLERRVQDRIEGPLLEVADTIGSLFRNARELMDRLPFIGRSRA